jgi:hypothetical protein
MVSFSYRYQFRQRFRAPARAAFEWATDFRPTDAALFGDRRQRTVRRIAPDALLVTDTTYPAGRKQRIARLVRLVPEELAWTNTHVSGPFRHSQFWYRIVPDGPRKSHLEFRGLKVEHRSRAPAAAEVRRLRSANLSSDATLWRRRLAPSLEADVR